MSGDCANPHIFITQELLDDADPAWLEQGEGLVRLCGSLVYRLDTYYGPDELVPGVWCPGPGWTATLIRTVEPQCPTWKDGSE